MPGHELSELQAKTDAAAAFLHRLVADGLMPTPQRYLSGLLERFHPVLRRGCDPCRAEMAACQFLGSLLPAALDGTVPDNTVPDNSVADNSLASRSLVELMTQIEAGGTREALAALRALAVVASPPARSTAGAAADRLAAAGLQDPTWAVGIGTPATGVCRSYAANGQQTVVATFTYPDRPAHEVVVLVDHQLGGGVKDCWVSRTPAGPRAGPAVLTIRVPTGIAWRSSNTIPATPERCWNGR